MEGVEGKTSNSELASSKVDELLVSLQQNQNRGDPLRVTRQWLNQSIVAANKSPSPLGHLGELASVIQVHINSRRETVEKLSSYLVTQIPNTAETVPFLSMHASALNRILDEQFEHIHQVDTEGSSIIKQLKVLNLLKTRLASCASVLTQMQLWKTRIKETDNVIASRDFEKISEELYRLRQSLIALENLPLHDTRKSELAKFENQLETMVAGHILDAFEARNLAQVNRFCAVLSKIDRLATARKYYLQSRADAAQSFLNKYFSSSAALNSSSSPREWAPAMFERLMQLIDQEIQWSQNLQCLCTPWPVLLDDLIETILSELRTQLGMYLADVVKRRDALFITSEFFNIMLQFSSDASELVGQFMAAKNSTPKSPGRDAPVIVLNTFQPFGMVFQAFSDIERKMFDSFLDSFHAAVHVGPDIGSNDPNDIYRITTSQLRSNNVSILELVSSCRDRMFSFSGGIVAPAFNAIVDQVLCAYLKRYSELVKQLRLISGFNNTDDFKADHSFANAEQLFELLRASRELIENINNFKKATSGELSTVIADILSVKQGPIEFTSNFVFHFLLTRMAGQLDALVPYVQGNTDLFENFSKRVPEFSTLLEAQVLDSMLCRILIRLKDFSKFDVWKTPDKKSIIPVFSSAPSDYITNVGDELLSLAQQCEIQAVFPVDFEHKVAVDHPDDLPAVMYWLERVVTRIAVVLEEKICRIPLLTKEGAKQMVTDFDCLMRIIDDLGLEIPNQLITLKTFISVSGEDLRELTFANHKQRELARSIAKIRKLNIQL
eukprot:TRINITY_DN11288_c0_g1_i1.p1 TRINITY_DN11288_c0_g1~~TRINITY_DN11288_c0_g1_i1.p1  ORF type:complete len:781 (-),score=210.45 TRINITY_DN11288_c0_g1_i1:1581-3923(-)